MNILNFKKREIITTVFAMLCLFGYVFFPAEGYFQYKAVAVIFLIIVPFLYSKYFLRDEKFFQKFTIGNWKKNLQWLSVGLLIATVLAALVFKYSDFLQQYTLAKSIKTSFKTFLIYEFTGVFFTVAVYELFFRNFLFFYFLKIIGKWAILVQFLFFVLLIFMIPSLPIWYYITYLIFAPIAGWIAYKSDSILYSFLGQFVFVILVDASFIALTVKN